MLLRFPASFLLPALLSLALLPGCTQRRNPAEAPAGTGHPAGQPSAAPEPLPELAEGGGVAAGKAAEQTVRRLPGEADSTFVRRVLPLAYAESNDLLAYAWRPGSYGKQLFLSRPGGADNDYGVDLFILDPYQPDTYAVQKLAIGSQGDVTALAAVFFADANQDGRKDLLVISVCALREEEEVDGEIMRGHVNHYRTDIWQYSPPHAAGRPQYQPDPTPRPYLDGLPTAAAVRQALDRQPGRPVRVAK